MVTNKITPETIQKALPFAKNQSQLLQAIGVSQSQKTYWQLQLIAEENGIVLPAKLKRNTPELSIPREKLQLATASSTSIAGICKQLGLKPNVHSSFIRLQAVRYGIYLPEKQNNFPSNPRTDISQDEITWLAGICEGEGSWSRVRQRDWILRVGMTDKDIIFRLRDLTGVGTITSYKPKKKYKTVWNWSVAKKTDREWITLIIWPWLGERRRYKIRGLWPAISTKLELDPEVKWK